INTNINAKFNDINQNINNRFDKINTDMNLINSRTHLRNTLLDTLNQRLGNLETSNIQLGKSINTVEGRISDVDNTIRNIRNDNLFNRLINMENILNTHMNTQDNILRNMRNLIEGDHTQFDILFTNFQRNMQDFINNRLKENERQIIKRFIESQPEKPKNVIIDYGRNLRLEYENFNIQERIIGSSQIQSLRNNVIINDFLNNVENNLNIQKQITSGTENDVMTDLRIHSSITSEELGSAIYEPRGSGSLTYETKSNSKESVEIIQKIQRSPSQISLVSDINYSDSDDDLYDTEIDKGKRKKYLVDR
ncbi:42_t:CDS:2, partial [Scutellospora calospora]